MLYGSTAAWFGIRIQGTNNEEFIPKKKGHNIEKRKDLILMAKKIFAAIVSAVMLICMAGCSDSYVMTEEDIAVQKSIEGCWLADASTATMNMTGTGISCR